MLTLSRVVARTTSSRFCRQVAHPALRTFSAAQVESKEDSKHSKLKIKSHAKDGEVVKKKELHSEALYQLEHDKAAEYASANQKKAMFVTKLGAGANLALAISKGTVGYAISSTGLIADAANSLGDLLSDAVVYYSVTEARKRATPDRPWGRGKIEPLGALTVGSLLLLTGSGIGYTACLAIVEAAAISNLISPHILELLQSGDIMQQAWSTLTGGGAGVGADAGAPPVPSGAPDPSAGAEDDGDGSLPKLVSLIDPEVNIQHKYAALGISGLSIGAKELLFRYTLKAGKAAHSDAVIANAWQHRADVSTSLAVFVGLLGSMAGYPILDPLAGLLVAGLIVRQGLLTSVDALRDLSDAPASAKETEQLKQTCLGVSGVMSVEALKARKSGPYLYVEATVDVDGRISASAAHRIAEITRQELLRRHNPRVANAVVDINPLGSSGLGENSPLWARDHDFIVEEVKKAATAVEEVISVSEVQVYYKDGGNIACKFDIVLNPSLTILQAHSIAVKTRRAIEEVLPGMGDIDVDLELDETKDEERKDGKDGKDGKEQQEQEQDKGSSDSEDDREKRKDTSGKDRKHS